MSDNLKFKSDYKDKVSCVKSIKTQFTILDDTKNNIFLIKEQDIKPLGCLYIPIISLNRIINGLFATEDLNGISGEIDDVVINFFVKMLKFHVTTK